jgi:DNA-directed RNA polymerase subunit H (RpoH/RPB5)
MLECRGYEVTAPDGRPIDLADLEERLLLGVACLYRVFVARADARTSLPPTLHVWYTQEQRASMDDVRAVDAAIGSDHAHILFSANGANTYIARFAPANIQVCAYTSFLVDPVDHIFVPPHVVLEREQRNAVLDRLAVHIHQLPRQTPSDNVSRYLGLRQGDAVLYRRADANNPTKPYVRVVTVNPVIKSKK